ncbi:hypothetical protein GC173_11250 [bacterium]|nr:hypothetical protein [bacterium]
MRLIDLVNYGLVGLLLGGSVAKADDFYFEEPSTTTKLSPEEIRKQIAAAPQKITTTVSGITFDSDYDNGSLVSVSAGANANTFSAVTYNEPGTISSARYWFRFRMTGGAGRTVTINIDHTQSPRPWYRFDSGPWTQMSSTQAPTTSQIILAIPADSTVAEVAFFHPYGYQETLDAVHAIIDRRSDATIEVIGQSTQGRDLHMITIEDKRFPIENKQRVWIHTRAHAGEVTSTHSMLGALQQITENSPTGLRLRQYGIFHIVPQVNADGIYMGMTRWTTTGNDLERMYCPPGTSGVQPTEPEAAAIKAQVDRWMAEPQPLKIALNLHSTQGSTWRDSFFFNHQPGSNGVTAAYTQYQKDYIEDLRANSATFDNRNPQTSNLADCIFVESYFYDNWNGAVMAITHEGHFSRRWYDLEYVTSDDYLEVGGGLARAVIPFLNFPALAPDYRTEGWFIE